MEYGKYSLSLPELLRGLAIYIFISAVVSYFFYKSVYVFLFLLPGLPVFFKKYKCILMRKRKKKLAEEFAETLCSVSVNLKAGYSVENAFLEAYKDLKLFYGEKSLMAAEILRIRKGLAINITLEDLISDLGKRSNIEDILMFSDVCKCAKRNGGNIMGVMTDTADRVKEKICIDKQIELIASEKIFELRIMEIVPFFILAYLNITSPGYFDCLYSGISGRVFMSVCLLIYVAAVIIGEKVMRINV